MSRAIANIIAGAVLVVMAFTLVHQPAQGAPGAIVVPAAAAPKATEPEPAQAAPKHVYEPQRMTPSDYTPPASRHERASWWPWTLPIFGSKNDCNNNDKECSK